MKVVSIEKTTKDVFIKYLRRNVKMKKVRVTLYQSENDDYVELWKVLDQKTKDPAYYGRYTYGDEGTWFYVADPLGYCELDRSVENDVLFICCDENGKECARYTNADKNPLPKFKTIMTQKWEAISQQIIHNTENMEKDFLSEYLTGRTTLKINQWLLTFKDPDLYEKEIADMNGYDENWTDCRKKEIGYESIPGSEFEYLGKKYQFTKRKMRHTVCGVEWVEFVCTDSPYIVDETYGLTYYGYMGNQFDETKTGACLDKTSAMKTVSKELEIIYGCKNVIDFRSVYDIQSYGLLHAAEKLLNGDLHKSNVRSVIEAEKEKKSFIPGTTEELDKLRKEHPDIPFYIWMKLNRGLI